MQNLNYYLVVLCFGNYGNTTVKQGNLKFILPMGKSINIVYLKILTQATSQCLQYQTTCES